jgi:hypothetical protein
MKRILTIILLLYPLFLSAQDVWREGTEWINYYDDGSMTIYRLSGKTVIEGTEYLNMYKEEDSISNLVAYVRSERGDTVVYIRACFQQKVYEEELLYDFGTFEPGTIMRYGIMGMPIKELVISEEALVFYHDVIKDGDALPCFRSILFKVGFIGNPIYLYQHPFEKTHPKAKNISHIVLKFNGWSSLLSVPSSSTINNVPAHTPSKMFFNVQGMRIIIPKQAIFIKDGKKYINKK